MLKLASESKEREKLDTFLSLFPESIFCYIPEPKTDTSGGVIHTKHLTDEYEGKGFASFLSVNGFGNGTVGRTDSDCTSLQHLYVDLDCPKDVKSEAGIKAYKQKALDSINAFDPICRVSALVETKNGFHVYFRITPSEDTNLSSLTPEKRAQVIKRYLGLLTTLRFKLNADGKAADLVRVLRVPYSLHRKDPERPFTCQLLATRVGDAKTLEAYAEILQPSEEERRAFEEKRAEAEAEAMWGTPKDRESTGIKDQRDIYNVVWKRASTGFEIPDEVRETFFKEAVENLDKVYPIMDRPSFASVAAPAGIQEGSRNSTLIIAASLMRRAGVSENEALAHLADYNNLKEPEIRGTVRSAYRRAEPFDFGWNHSVFGPHVGIGERKKVKDTISLYCSNRLSEYLKQKRSEQREAGEADSSKESRHDPLPTEVPILPASEQKALLDTFPDAFLETHEHLRFVPEGGYFIDLRKNEEGHVVWKVIDKSEIERMVMHSIESLGLVKMATSNIVASQVKRLAAKPSISLSIKSVNSDKELKQDKQSKGPFVPVLNGIYDMEKKTIYPYCDRAIFLSPIQTPFLPESEVPEADTKLVADFISSIAVADPERIRALQKIAGYCLLNDNRFQKSFYFLGEGSNGKSTYQNMIGNMLGLCNTLAFTFRELNGHFFAASIMGKRFGLVEEINGNFFESDGFKRITGTSAITADRKNRDPITFIPFMKVVISMNQLPKVNDVGEGYYRRLTIVQLLAHFCRENGNEDFGIEDKLKAASPAVLHFAVKGLGMLLEDNGFGPTKDDIKVLDDYKEANSSLLTFLSQDCRPSEDASFSIPVGEFYQAYADAAKRNGMGVKGFPIIVSELKSLNTPAWKNLNVSADKKFVTGVIIIPSTLFHRI